MAVSTVCRKDCININSTWLPTLISTKLLKDFCYWIYCYLQKRNPNVPTCTKKINKSSYRKFLDQNQWNIGNWYLMNWTSNVIHRKQIDFFHMKMSCNATILFHMFVSHDLINESNNPLRQNVFLKLCALE
jgi:hypothetical protein